jgi:ABC-type Fe3+/spermidine/putrescine transport system ATPase subunit
MLDLRHIYKTYNSAPLLQDVSLTINAGEIVCLLGPSGSGKTTLLRIIAGLETAEQGEIFFAGQDMRHVPVHQRNFGMMFQDLALFPHKNVFENVAFGLRMQNVSPAEIRTRVQEILDLVGLRGFGQRNVNQLSGGEQQRVALARALAPQPRLLMFDEPLGALDRILREQLVVDLRSILKRIGMTALYVTHDQDEAFAIADRIAIIHAGRIVQIGLPAEIYHAPANAFVARFLGMTNLLPARWKGDHHIETALGVFPVTSPLHAENFVALVRPDQIRINASASIRAHIAECTFRVGRYRLRAITTTGIELIIDSQQLYEVGAEVGLEINAVELVAA